MQGKPPWVEASADVLHGNVHYLTAAVSVMGAGNHNWVLLPLPIGGKKQRHCAA